MPKYGIVEIQGIKYYIRNVDENNVKQLKQWKTIIKCITHFYDAEHIAYKLRLYCIVNAIYGKKSE